MAARRRHEQQEDAMDSAIPKFDADNRPQLVYRYSLVRGNSPDVVFTYNLNNQYKLLRESDKSFRISWLKEAITKHFDKIDNLREKEQVIKMEHINLIFKGKILLDKDNIFNVGLVDGCRISVIYKTEGRKVLETRIMDHSLKYLPEDKRGIEQAVIKTARELEYEKGNFGLADMKLKMLVNTMIENPILTVRYSENQMVQRLIMDMTVRKEIYDSNQYFKNIRDSNPRLQKILAGQDEAGLNQCKSWFSSTHHIRDTTKKHNDSKTKLTNLVNYIRNPDSNLNPLEADSGMGPSGGMFDESTDGAGGGMFDDNEDAIFFGDRKPYHAEDPYGGAKGDVKPYPPGIRADLKDTYDRHKQAYKQLVDMGLDDVNKVLTKLKQANGDISRALDLFYEDFN